MKKLPIFFFLTMLLILNSNGQNETKQWYFGTNTGLDFNTSPPTVILSSAMNSYAGCASTADSSGSLLFYTNGDTIWNRLHQVMANGAGLLGSSHFTQSSLILKQPGSSSLYYVFTMKDQNYFSSLYYSIVDMSAAAGMGSVTVKNYSVYSGPYSERLTATKHCNGTDYWLLIANSSTNLGLGLSWQDFMAYKLTAAGITTNAVVSTITTETIVLSGQRGAMKISPNGKRIGLASNSSSISCFEVLDFDNSIGQVSNPIVFYQVAPNYGYGCEFSPNSSKFYGSTYGTIGGMLYQWNLSLNSKSAIISSKTFIGSVYGTLQLAPNGKVYGAQLFQQSLGVINFPDSIGLQCNFVSAGQTLGANNSNFGLPNFAGNFFNTSPALSFNSNSGLTMCIGETKTLIVSGATSYSWNGSLSGSSLVISPNGTSTYSVIGTTTSGCIYDAVVTVTVSNCVGLNENSITGLKVFPNPAKDLLQIQINSYPWNEFMRLDIFNSIGQLISTQEFSNVNKIENINVSGIETGMYTICFTNSKKVILIRKLIISR